MSQARMVYPDGTVRHLPEGDVKRALIAFDKLTRLDRNHMRVRTAELCQWSATEAEGRALYRRDMVRAMRDIWVRSRPGFHTFTREW